MERTLRATAARRTAPRCTHCWTALAVSPGRCTPTTRRTFTIPQLNKQLNLIRNCKQADTSPPASWDTAEDGVYSPEFDGQIVAGTACDGIPTDYVPYRELQPTRAASCRSPRSATMQRNFDALGRVRRPYMFGTDNYADISNLAVLRHDNGADAYETTHYLISEYEDRYLFDDYRRNRTSFSLRNAFMRGFNRYNDQADGEHQGLWPVYNELFQSTGLFDSPYRERRPVQGQRAGRIDGLRPLRADPHASNSWAPTSATTWSPFKTRILAPFHGSKTERVAIDHGAPGLLIPDGSTGDRHGRRLGRAAAQQHARPTKGYYAVDYDFNVGSYYDKTLTIHLMTVIPRIRFISESRDDFQDGRYRNTSFRHAVPRGFAAPARQRAHRGRRHQGLAGGFDERRAERRRPGRADAAHGLSRLVAQGRRTLAGPRRAASSARSSRAGTAGSNAPAELLAVDPEVGFEVQKFITFFSMLNLPESCWKLNWVDMMRVWQIGVDSAPGFTTPSGRLARPAEWAAVHSAHRYGTEVIDGKTVQRGIAARVLEWMNTLTAWPTASTTVVNPTGERQRCRAATDNSACPAGVRLASGQPMQISNRLRCASPTTRA